MARIGQFSSQGEVVCCVQQIASVDDRVKEDYDCGTAEGVM